MESNSKITVSTSSESRFRKIGRSSQLQSFKNFKHEYQNYFTSQKIGAIKKIYQHGICGRNHHRQTVVVDRIGNIKIQELSKLFEDDELVSYMNQRLLNLSENVLSQNQQLVWIVDLSGKIMQLASKRILESLTKIIYNAQHFFPEILQKLIFVNTPMLFDTIWSKITQNMAKQTLEKIVMIGQQMENLYEYAEPSILPQFLGGEIDEERFLNDNQSPQEKKDEEDEEDEDEEEQVDFSSLRQALSGLKVAGSFLQSVSQTPLNTQADDK